MGAFCAFLFFFCFFYRVVLSAVILVSCHTFNPRPLRLTIKSNTLSTVCRSGGGEGMGSLVWAIYSKYNSGVVLKLGSHCWVGRWSSSTHRQAWTHTDKREHTHNCFSFSPVRMTVIDWWNGPLPLVVFLFALCLLLLTWSITSIACRACHSSGTFFPSPGAIFLVAFSLILVAIVRQDSKVQAQKK